MYAIYLRKSRADTEAESRGEGETLSRHRAALLELAKKQQLNIIKIYEEIVSGDSISARPQMQLLLSEIAENKYHGVLVMEIERLARGDTIDQGLVAKAFGEFGTKIITPSKTYDPNNEFDEEYFEFSLFMSRREYKTINRRMQVGRLAAVKEGNYICSRPPYGYRKISPAPKIHTLEIVSHEAETVRLIYGMYLDGKGGRAIATALNDMGIKPQKKEFWEKPSIKKILTNPLYCGKVTWTPKRGELNTCDGLHEPIISQEIFEAVQQKKKTNPAAQLRPNEELKNYYHGILYCGNCGHQMKRRHTVKTDHEHLLCRYRECRGKVVSATTGSVDEAMLSAFKFRIKELESLLKNGVTQQNFNLEAQAKKILTAELEKAEIQQSRLYDLLEQEIYDTAVFLERNGKLSAHIKKLKQQLEESVPQKEQIPPEQAIAQLQHIIEIFYNAHPEQRNDLLRQTVNKIYYYKTQRMCCNNMTSDLRLDVDFK